MLSEQQVLDLIEIRDNGLIQVRWRNEILRDNELVTYTYHRQAFEPGADLSNEDARIIAVAQVVWTSEVIQRFNSYKSSLLPPVEESSDVEVERSPEA